MPPNRNPTRSFHRLPSRATPSRWPWAESSYYWFPPSDPKVPLLHPLGLVSPTSSSIGAWGRLLPLASPWCLQGRLAPPRPLSPRFSMVLLLRRFSFAPCDPPPLHDAPAPPPCIRMRAANDTSSTGGRAHIPLPLLKFTSSPAPVRLHLPLPFAERRPSGWAPF